MKRKHIIMLVRSVNIKRGGITKAVFKRSNLFIKKGHKVTILTTLYQPRHAETVDKIYESGELDKRVEIKNFFEVKRLEKKSIFNKKHKYKIEDKTMQHFRVKHHQEKSYRYYLNGKYVEYRRFSDFNSLKFRDYHGNQINEGMTRKYREEYADDGLLTRRIYYNASNKPVFHQYFNTKNEPLFSAHFTSNSDTPYSVLEYKGKSIKEYKNWDALLQRWIKEEVEKEKNSVLISEQRTSDKYIYSINSEDVKKIIMIHSNHLKSPYTESKYPTPSYLTIAEKKDQIDNVIVLTEEQKDDLNLFIKDEEKIKVIPHAYDNHKDDDSIKEVDRDYNKVVIVSRYVEGKRIDHGITAFKQVVKELPEARLVVYGAGPEKSNLKKLVTSLELNKNVQINDYTSNAKAVYKSAALMLMLSKNEGFGMVITESMAMGTPVISYDFKYGPSDIITHKKDGYIVENGNIEELSNIIIKLLKNKDEIDELSQEALNVKEKYSETRYETSWLEIIE